MDLKPKEEIAGGVVYESARNTACFMHPTPNAGISSASQAFWQVEDLAREIAELKRRGVMALAAAEGPCSPGGHASSGRRQSSTPA